MVGRTVSWCIGHAFFEKCVLYPPSPVPPGCLGGIAVTAPRVGSFAEKRPAVSHPFQAMSSPAMSD
jgi:hypothetical protein